MRLIDETGLVFPRQSFGPDPQWDFGACVCLISVLVGLGPGLELGAVQLVWMCALYTFPRKAVAPVAESGSRHGSSWLSSLLQTRQGCPCALGLLGPSQAGASGFAWAARTKSKLYRRLFFPTCPIFCRITNFGPEVLRHLKMERGAEKD